MNIKPLADRVLVEPKEAETKTASGLYIPDTAKEKPQAGKVVAVGNGKKDEPMELKSRRQCALRKICRYRNQCRWKGLPYDASVRHSCNSLIFKKSKKDNYGKRD